MASEMEKTYPDYGALEESLSGYGLQRSAAKYIGGEKEITAREIFNMAKGGIPWAVELVNAFKRQLSKVLVAISTLFDPEIIVLGGGVMESAYTYLPEIRRKIAVKTPNPIHVEYSELGRNARVLGGCASVLHHVTHCSILKEMV